MVKTDHNLKIKFLLYVCIIVIVGQLVLLTKISGNITRVKSHIGDLNATKATIEYRNCELQCIGRQILESQKLFVNNSPIPVKDVLGGRKTLVYYFSKMYCKVCVESQIEVIKAVFAADSTNIVLLAHSSNYKELYVLKHTLGIKCPIYKVDHDLNLPCDTIRMPYFVLLDENLKVINAFITMKERMNYSIAYLKSMYRYFHSENVVTNALNIVIDDTHIDLGNVRNGSSKTVRFAITNNSVQNVQLDVIPDCDCTTIDFGNGTLQAQEKRRITATIKFDEEGEFVKYIYVYYNNNQNPIEVEIRGNVI